MGLVRLLGFAKLPCGCVTGRYREMAPRREVVYVEEKGPACRCPSHRRNQPTSVGAVPGVRPPMAGLARVG
jgi:hypothetical protein